MDCGKVDCLWGAPAATKMEIAFGAVGERFGASKVMVTLYALQVTGANGADAPAVAAVDSRKPNDECKKIVEKLKTSAELIRGRDTEANQNASCCACS